MSLQPIKTNTFKLAEHSFRRFSCSIEASVTEEQLTNKQLWVNVSAKINDGDEIRVVADDYTFVATLFVTHVRGHDVVTKLLSFTRLDYSAEEEGEDYSNLYDVTLKGVKKFCIVDKRTGDHIKEDIPDKKTAYRELDDYIKAIHR